VTAFEQSTARLVAVDDLGASQVVVVEKLAWVEIKHGSGLARPSWSVTRKISAS
jgi:hypothetical protein